MGLIEVTLDSGEQTWPQEVKDNFQEKVEALHEYLQNELAEMMQFGQSFDTDDDDLVG